MSIIINKMPEIIGEITHISLIIFLYFQAKICYNFSIKNKEINASYSMTMSNEQASLNTHVQPAAALEQAYAELNKKYSVLELQHEAVLQKLQWFGVP